MLVTIKLAMNKSLNSIVDNRISYVCIRDDLFPFIFLVLLVDLAGYERLI